MTFLSFWNRKMLYHRFIKAQKYFLCLFISMAYRKKEIIDGVIRNLILPVCLGVYVFHALYNKERRIYVQEREWQKLNFVNAFFFYYCAKSFYKMIQTSARWRVHSSKRNYCFNSSPSFLMKFNVAGHMPACRQIMQSLSEKNGKRFIAIRVSESIANLAINREENVHLNNRLLPFSGCCERASFHRLNKNYNENWQNPISMSNLQWHLMALKLCLRQCTVGCR